MITTAQAFVDKLATPAAFTRARHIAALLDRAATFERSRDGLLLYSFADRSSAYVQHGRYCSSDGAPRPQRAWVAGQ